MKNHQVVLGFGLLNAQEMRARRALLARQDYVWVSVDRIWTRVRCRFDLMGERDRDEPSDLLQVLIADYQWLGVPLESVRTDEEHARLCLTE